MNDLIRIFGPEFNIHALKIVFDFIDGTDSITSHFCSQACILGVEGEENCSLYRDSVLEIFLSLYICYSSLLKRDL